MSSKRLTLDLILSTIDKASAPLKKVALSTDGAAKSLKAARETSKRLNDQLGDVRKYRSTRAQLRLNGAQTKKYTNQLEEANSEVKAQYAAHDRIKGTLRAAEKRYKLLVKQFEDGAGTSQEFRYELDKARMKVDTMTRAVSESNSKLRQYRGKAGHAKTMLKQLARQHTDATKTLHIYREKLDSAGIGTDKLATKNRELQRAANGANDELKEQQARLQQINQLQQKSQRINSKAATLAGYSTAATAAGGLALNSMSGMMAPVVQAQAGGSLIAARQGQDSALASGYTDIINDIQASGSMAEVAEIANALDGAASAFGRLGKTGADELQRITSHALTLNKAFGTDTAQSIQMAQIMLKNGLAGSADEAFDLITKGMQNVTAEMRGELPEILHEYSTHFRGMGFSGQQSMNLLIKMAEQGKFALDKTGDAVKEFSIRGSDMSKASVEAYELIGLNAHKMSNAIATGGNDAQKALQATVKGLLELTDPAERANAAIALFGTPVEDLAIDQIPNFLAALGGAKDVLDDSRGSAERLGETLRDNLQGDLSKLSGSWASLKKQLFNGESGALRGLAQQLNGVVQQVTTWTKENPELAAWLVRIAAIAATVVTVLGALGLAVSTVMFGWAGLLKMAPVLGLFKAMGPVLLTLGKVALPVVAGGIKAITAALIANPIGLIVAAIAGAAYLIYKNWAPIKQFFVGLWQHVKAAFDEGLAGISALLLNWSPIGLLYKAIRAGLAQLGIELPAQLSDAFSMALSSGTKLFSSWASGLWKQVKAAFGQGISGMAALLINWSPLGLLYSGIQQGLSALGIELPDSLTGVFSNALDTASNLLLNWNPITLLYSGIQQGLSALGIELPATFSELGGNIIKGLMNGITNMIPNVREKISSIGESVSGWFRGVLGINSPSRVFASHGGDVMAGLQQGIGNGESGVMDRILGLGSRLIEQGKAIAGKLGLALGDLKNSALDKLNAAGGWLSDQIGFSQPELQPAGAGGELSIDKRPPLQGAGRQPQPVSNTLSIGEIHVHAAPGMDEQAVARLVALEIQRLQERQSASTRSNFSDED